MEITPLKTKPAPPRVKNESGFEPVGELILIRLIEVEEKSAGGIVLAQATRDNEALGLTTGMVMAFAPFAQEHIRAQTLSVGDLVVFAKYGGKLEVGRDGAKYRFIRPDDLQGRRTEAAGAVVGSAAMSPDRVFDFNYPPQTPVDTQI